MLFYKKGKNMWQWQSSFSSQIHKRQFLHQNSQDHVSSSQKKQIWKNQSFSTWIWHFEVQIHGENEVVSGDFFNFVTGTQ